MKKYIDTSALLVTLCVEVGVTLARRIPMATWIAAVRHPQKQDDIDGIHRGDAALITEQGEREADVLVQRALLMDLDAVLCSDCPRTFALATRIGNAIGCKVETNALFREWRQPSFMEGQSIKDNVLVRETKLLMRTGFDSDVTVTDGESRTMIEERTRQAMDYVVSHPRARVLLVSHAKFICGMITMTIWGSLKGYYRGPDRSLKLDNTGVSIFVKEADRRDSSQRLVVKTVNDVSHQEIEFYQDVQRMFRAAE
jgi:broad specificity phosphatase PhoE